MQRIWRYHANALQQMDGHKRESIISWEMSAGLCILRTSLVPSSRVSWTKYGYKADFDGCRAWSDRQGNTMELRLSRTEEMESLKMMK